MPSLPSLIVNSAPTAGVPPNGVPADGTDGFITTGSAGLTDDVPAAGGAAATDHSTAAMTLTRANWPAVQAPRRRRARYATARRTRRLIRSPDRVCRTGTNSPHAEAATRDHGRHAAGSPMSAPAGGRPAHRLWGRRCSRLSYRPGPFFHQSLFFLYAGRTPAAP